MRRFCTGELVKKAVKLHTDYTEQILLEDVVLLPGVLELLGDLRGPRGRKPRFFYKQAHVGARRICEHLGVTPLVNGVFGTLDTPWVKPQREFTEYVLAALGADAASAVLVGDSPFDVQTAHNASFPCWAVTTARTTPKNFGRGSRCRVRRLSRAAGGAQRAG